MFYILALKKNMNNYTSLNMSRDTKIMRVHNFSKNVESCLKPLKKLNTLKVGSNFTRIITHSFSLMQHNRLQTHNPA